MKGHTPVYYFLLAVIAALPFMDFEVVRVAGKSIVLPYAVTFALAIPLLRVPARAIRAARTDRALPLLVCWLLVDSLAGGVAFLWYPGTELLQKNVTQALNVGLMVVQYALLVAALRLIGPDETDGIVRAIVLSGILAALYSLAQVGGVVVGLPLPDLFRTSNLYMKLNTLTPSGGGGWIGVPRAMGAAPEPSFWGGYLLFSSAFALGRFELGRGYRAGLRLVLLLLAVLITFARGAWFTASLVGVACLAMRHGSARRKRPSAWPVYAVLVLAVSVTFSVPLLGENSGFARIDRSAIERLSSQKTGYRILADHPVLGVGLGSIESLAEQYAFYFPGYSDMSFSVLHNWYLTVQQIGLAVRSASNPAARSLALSSALACVSVFGFWVNNPAYNMTFLWVALAMGATAWRAESRAD
jgi:O-Antigen ligase